MIEKPYILLFQAQRVLLQEPKEPQKTTACAIRCHHSGLFSWNMKSIQGKLLSLCFDGSQKNQQECVNSLLRRDRCCLRLRCDVHPLFLISALLSQQVWTKGDSNSGSDTRVNEIIAIKCFTNEQFGSSLTFIWSYQSVWSSSVPLLSSHLLSRTKYFLTSLLQGQKRRLHQFSNDESPVINSKVREGWRFAARDKVDGRLEIIHHWHGGTQSKSLLLYWAGVGGTTTK